MDPEHAYHTLTKIAGDNHPHSEETRGNLLDMIDAWNALDEWLRKGGYLPISWRNAGQERKQ